MAFFTSFTEDRIVWALKTFKTGLVLTTSGGKTSAVLPHLIKSVTPNNLPLIIFIDTGYYGKSTHGMIQRLRNEGFTVKIYKPIIRKEDIEKLYSSWWDKNRDAVLPLIKHEPLDRAFQELGVKAWISGIMAWQTGERREIPLVEYKNGIHRIHPIHDWSKEQLQEYIAENNLPLNEAHFDITKGLDQKKECKIHTR